MKNWSQRCMTPLSWNKILFKTEAYVVASMRNTFMDSAIMELVSIWP